MKKAKKRMFHYHNFILTIWAEASERLSQPLRWHFRLENPHTAEQQGFKTVSDLTTFLSQWTNQESTKEIAIEE